MHNTYNYKVQLENVDANNPGTLGCFYRKCNPDWWMCLGRVKKETYMYTYAAIIIVEFFGGKLNNPEHDHWFHDSSSGDHGSLKLLWHPLRSFWKTFWTQRWLNDGWLTAKTAMHKPSFYRVWAVNILGGRIIVKQRRNLDYHLVECGPPSQAISTRQFN